MAQTQAILQIYAKLLDFSKHFYLYIQNLSVHILFFMAQMMSFMIEDSDFSKFDHGYSVKLFF